MYSRVSERAPSAPIIRSPESVDPSAKVTVPAEVKDKVAKIKAGLTDGSFVIWKGPIVGQDGKEVLAKDVVADDKFLSGVNFYIKGVEGKVPAGN